MKRPLLDRLDMVNEWVGRIIAFLVVAIIGIILFEVTLRYGFNNPTIWAHETSGLLQMVYILLGGGYTLLHNGHVKIDILYDRLSPKQRAISDLTIGSILFLCFACILLWHGGIIAYKSIMIREISSSGLWKGPLYPFKVLVPIGTLLIMFQWVIIMIRDFKQVRAKNLR